MNEKNVAYPYTHRKKCTANGGGDPCGCTNPAHHHEYVDWDCSLPKSTGGGAGLSRAGKKERRKHIRALRRMFPNSTIDTTEEFLNKPEGYGIWTSFADEWVNDDLIANSDRSGESDEFAPKLKSYMDKNALYGEWYDGGTLFIFGPWE